MYAMYKFEHQLRAMSISESTRARVCKHMHGYMSKTLCTSRELRMYASMHACILACTSGCICARDAQEKAARRCQTPKVQARTQNPTNTKHRHSRRGTVGWQCREASKAAKRRLNR